MAFGVTRNVITNTTALGFDDSLIERVVLERAGVDTKQPRCEVEVEVAG